LAVGACWQLHTFLASVLSALPTAAQ